MSERAKHTPGPWKVEHDASRAGMRLKITAPTPKADRRYTVAVAVSYDPTEDAVTEADARLIAAAPAMFDELRRVAAKLRASGWGAIAYCEADSIDHVLSQATGGTTP